MYNVQPKKGQMAREGTAQIKPIGDLQVPKKKTKPMTNFKWIRLVLENAQCQAMASFFNAIMPQGCFMVKCKARFPDTTANAFFPEAFLEACIDT